MVLTEKDLKQYLIEKGHKVTIGKSNAYIYAMDWESELLCGHIAVRQDGTFALDRKYMYVKYNADNDTLLYCQKQDSWRKLKVETENITINDCFIINETADEFVSRYIDEHPDEIDMLIEKQIKTYQKENKKDLAEIKDISKLIEQRYSNIGKLTVFKLYQKRPDYLKDIKTGDKFETLDGTICELDKIDQDKCLKFTYMLGKRKFSLNTYPNGHVNADPEDINEFDIIKKI